MAVLFFRESGPQEPLRAAILLHGRGSDEEDLLPLRDVFSPDTRVLSVRAPYRWGPGYAWYEMDEYGSPRESELAASVAGIVEVIEGQPLPVILMGFSQGGLMAVAAAAHRRGQGVRAVISLSAPPLPIVGTEQPLSGIPAFWGHGRQDAMVAPGRGQTMQEALVQLGAQVTGRQYNMGHTIVNEELDDIKNWLVALKK